MPQIADPYVIEAIPGGRFRFSLTSASGQTREIIRVWKR
jgi:hypothetical protein